MLQTKVKPNIGLLPTGHKIYWGQFPELKARGEKMFQKLIGNLSNIGNVIAADLVDSVEKAQEAGKLFREQDIDVLLIFPFGYAIIFSDNR